MKVAGLFDQPSFLEALTFKEAEGQERASALELQRRVYAEDLGHAPNDGYDELAYHLIACRHDHEVIAAFRMVGPTQRPFDIERVVTLSEFIGAERSTALVGRLCVRRDYRGVSSSTFISLGMLKLAYAFARQHSITDLLLIALPHLRNFYRSAFFRPLDISFEHPTGGRVHVMHLDLLEFEARYSQSPQPIARFLFRTDLPNFQV